MARVPTHYRHEASHPRFIDGFFFMGLVKLSVLGQLGFADGIELLMQIQLFRMAFSSDSTSRIWKTSEM